MDQINIDQTKREARILSKHSDLSHMQCIEHLARSYGYKTYAAMRAAAINGSAPNLNHLKEVKP